MTVAGDVTFDAATVSNINLNITNDANLVMNGTMQGGALSGRSNAKFTNGILDNVNTASFSGVAKDVTFKNYGLSFVFNNNVRFDGTTTIYADNVSGVYRTAYAQPIKTEFIPMKN